MSLNIEEMETVDIAYLRRTGPYGPENRRLMERLKAFLRERGGMGPGTVLLGIALDDPAETPADRCRYDVGIVLRAGERLPLDTRRVRGGRYAVFEIPHTEGAVSRFWGELGRLTAGLPVDRASPVLERYSAEKVALHRCEFCVPLT